MSFGTSVGDAIAIVKLAWNTVEGARKATGEHSELAREVSGIYNILHRLHDDLNDPESLLGRNAQNSDRRAELDNNLRDCHRLLNVVNAVLMKYNSLAEDKRSSKKLFQKIRFGNGEMRDLSEIRLKLLTHTNSISMNLQQISVGSQGRIEGKLASYGGKLEGIRESVDLVLAKMTARSSEGSVLTSYANDDKQFWKELRRDLVNDGYSSTVLQRHKNLLKAYIAELGERGILDEPPGFSEIPTPANFITADLKSDSESASKSESESESESDSEKEDEEPDEKEEDTSFTPFSDEGNIPSENVQLSSVHNDHASNDELSSGVDGQLRNLAQEAPDGEPVGECNQKTDNHSEKNAEVPSENSMERFLNIQIIEEQIAIHDQDISTNAAPPLKIDDASNPSKDGSQSSPVIQQDRQISSHVDKKCEMPVLFLEHQLQVGKTTSSNVSETPATDSFLASPSSSAQEVLSEYLVHNDEPPMPFDSAAESQALAVFKDVGDECFGQKPPMVPLPVSIEEVLDEHFSQTGNRISLTKSMIALPPSVEEVLDEDFTLHNSKSGNAWALVSTQNVEVGPSGESNSTSGETPIQPGAVVPVEQDNAVTDPHLDVSGTDEYQRISFEYTSESSFTDSYSFSDWDYSSDESAADNWSSRATRAPSDRQPTSSHSRNTQEPSSSRTAFDQNAKYNGPRPRHSTSWNHRTSPRSAPHSAPGSSSNLPLRAPHIKINFSQKDWEEQWTLNVLNGKTFFGCPVFNPGNPLIWGSALPGEYIVGPSVNPIYDSRFPRLLTPSWYLSLLSENAQPADYTGYGQYPQNHQYPPGPQFPSAHQSSGAEYAPPPQGQQAGRQSYAQHPPNQQTPNQGYSQYSPNQQQRSPGYSPYAPNQQPGTHGYSQYSPNQQTSNQGYPQCFPSQQPRNPGYSPYPPSQQQPGNPGYSPFVAGHPPDFYPRNPMENMYRQ